MGALPVEQPSPLGKSITLSSPSESSSNDVEATLMSEKMAEKQEVNTQRINNDKNNLKWFVLVFLVLQNSSASILMRYSRSETGASWNPQTGVVMQEVIKAVACILLLLKDGSLASAFVDKTEAMKTAIPAICYLIQNNLQYVAVGYLDASTYAVLYQLKILTTALLSVVILKKELACIQWVSLALLTVGVSTVVLSQMSQKAAEAGKEGSDSEDSILPGLAAVLTACLMSGLAGVYFEKLLKGSTVSLWARNLQLALYSIVIGVGGLAGQNLGDSSSSIGTDFFKGYTTAVWFSILNNAFGGLLVAVVIKYADVILKNFSASLSIILTATISAAVFGSVINSWFVVGTVTVIYAMFLYGKINPMDLLKNFSKLQGQAVKEKTSPPTKSPMPEKS